MLQIQPGDQSLESLAGTSIASNVSPSVTYRIERVLGAGGMAVAFFASRLASDGQTPVVVKILRPDVVREVGAAAALMVTKEAVALGRLNERIPPTPFVVRLIDTGEVRATQGSATVNLPWLAIEHVHGGPEGTTLEERVEHSLRHTRHAFDAARAANAIDSLAQGLTAIHEVNVIHRDLKPGNVLCCGFGDDEIFKIADFGIARPGGMAATFGGIVIGTPGYAPPEQFLLDLANVGLWSDLFALGAVIYYVLTGEQYFQVRHPGEAAALAQSSARRRLLDAAGLCRELRDRPSACEAIDGALARATAVDPKQRPQSATALAAMVVPHVRPPSARGTELARRARSVIGDAPTLISGWSWIPRHMTGDDRLIRRVAWDGDGRCLAATDSGLAFWNGTSWLPVSDAALPEPARIRFVRRMGAGVWLVGGVGASCVVYTPGGITEQLHGTDKSVTFEDACGDIQELAVFVGSRMDDAPLLLGLSSRHWIKPASIGRAASIAGLAQLDETRWLVVGRSREQRGFAVVYTPLMWEIEKVRSPVTRAYLACATRPDLETGIFVGTEGHAVRMERGGSTPSIVEGSPDLSAVALDVAGRAWAASTGRLWVELPDEPGRWRLAWSDSSWDVPIVSVFASLGLVIAMTADGGLLEGRFDQR